MADERRIEVRHRPFDVKEARLQLDMFEFIYRVPSTDRDKPFWEDGKFVETDDWRRWDRIYTAWARATGEAEHPRRTP